MKYLVLIFLVGCAFEPISRDFVKKTKKPYRQRVIECTERFVENFGTDLKVTLEACKQMEGGINQ